VCPAAASTRCQVVGVRGCPCSSTTGAPAPPWRPRSFKPSLTSTLISSNPSNLRLIMTQPAHVILGEGHAPRRDAPPATGIGVRLLERRAARPQGDAQPDGHLGVQRAGACLGSLVEFLRGVVVEPVHIELVVVAEARLG